MRQVTLDDIRMLAEASRAQLWEDARNMERDVKIYLHWTAGRYIRWGSNAVASGILAQSYQGSSKFPSLDRQNAYDGVVKIAFGGDQPHNNMPPYYVLAWIMKL